MKLRELGERKAIDLLWQNVIGESVNYDDCAYVEHGAEFQLFTTDFVGEGSHFLPGTAPEKVGRFVASVNLSDIAAMGGIADFFLLSAFMPGNREFDFISGVVAGIKEILDEYGVRYLGGDMKESTLAGFSGFAVGHVERDRIIRRTGARVGDLIAITAPPGRNAAAYYLWKFKGMAFEDVIDVVPRLREGRKIAGAATSGMDTSDGIISSLVQLQNINGLGFEVNVGDIPLHPLAVEVIEDYGISALQLLEFGGDYELVYTSPKKIIGKEIGRVIESKLDYGGAGYEHFSKTLD